MTESRTNVPLEWSGASSFTPGDTTWWGVRNVQEGVTSGPDRRIPVVGTRGSEGRPEGCRLPVPWSEAGVPGWTGVYTTHDHGGLDVR